MTKKCIHTLCFGKRSVIKLIKASDISKANSHGGIIVKLSTDSHSLALIFQNS